MVNYTYNAWGEIISTTGTLASTIGAVNKLRYRSYYYDTETGFYYLQSRYYDPIVKRFISPDSTDYLTENGSFDGYNLYAYCVNNPVMYSDPSGSIAFDIIFKIITGAVIGGTIACIAEAIAQHFYYKRSWTTFDKKELGIAFAAGAVNGALTALGVSILSKTRAIAKGVNSMITSVLKSIKKSKIKTVGKALKVIGSAVASGIATAAVEYYRSTHGKVIGYDTALSLVRQLVANGLTSFGMKTITVHAGWITKKITV